MFEMILAQMGIKKEDVERLGERVVNGVDDIERRLERIEKALGIEEPLPLRLGEQGTPDNPPSYEDAEDETE